MTVQLTSLNRLLILSVTLTALVPVHGQETQKNQDQRLFQFEPDTPEQFVRAAVVAADLDRTRLAREYLQTLVERNLSNDELVMLRKAIDIGHLLQLNANVELQPFAGQLLQLVNEASKRQDVTPEAMEDLVEQLDGSRDDAVTAATQLVAIGDPAAMALVTTDPETASGSLAHGLLRRYVRQFRFGLAEALPHLEPKDQVRALKLIRSSADAALAPRLLRYEFGSDNRAVIQQAQRAVSQLWSESGRPTSRDEAVRWLTRRAIQNLTTASNRFVNDSSAEQLATAMWLSEDAVLIDSQNQEAIAVRLACRCAVDGGAADGATPEERSAALDVAIKAGSGTATAALLNSDPDRLRRAMELPDAVVRVDAASRLLRLNRRVRGAAFAGLVIESAAAGSQKPEAVVIDPRDEAGQAAFMLRVAGYDVVTAATGQAGFDRAVAQLNCELILIHTNCLRWSLSPTIANLRADSRTRRTPIVVYGPAWTEESVAGVQSRYDGVWFLRGPLSEISFAEDMRVAGVPGPRLSREHRVALIEQARELASSAAE